MFLMWYDDNPKHAPLDKLTAASAAYLARFNTMPNVALVCPDENYDGATIAVRAVGYIRRNNLQVGWDEAYS